MHVISHRGLSTSVPENTLEAFEQAVAVGVDGIETDIRFSRDGQAVLYHDRLTPSKIPVASLDHPSLCREVGYSVPTLQQALETWNQVAWILEIKSPQAVDATLAILEGFRSSRQCLMVSFWHPVIQHIRRQSSWNCGLLLRHRPFELPPWRQCRQLQTLLWDYEFLDAALLDQMSEAGWNTLVYGAGTLREHRECLAMDIQGVITDRPDWLLGSGDGDPPLQASVDG